MRVLRSALVAAASAVVLMTGIGMAAPAQAQSRIPSGIYSIHNVGYISQVMEVGESDNAVHGWRESESGRQNWDVELSEGHYTIRNLETGEYLAPNDSAAVVQPEPAQWNLALVPGFRVKIEAVDDGRVLTLTSGRNGASVALEDYSGRANQHWYFQHRGD
jgi:hypothetical protein